jgi:Peptidase A4 family
MQTPGIDELRRMHTFFKPPPDGFKPLEATDRELALYGFPDRPDATLHPRLRAKWDRVMGRPHRVIVPTLEIRPGFRTRPSQTVGGEEAAPATNDHWSGAVVAPPANQSFTTVSGSWIVPNAFPPPSAWTGSGWTDGTYLAVTWIGIDGWGVTGSTDVLQAGTGTQVTVTNGNVSLSCFAWYEWWTDLWIVFSNFAVSPGDLIACTVCGTSPTHGFAAMSNLTTSQSMSIGINPPSGIALTGNCAEWIVERPSNSLGVAYTLPDYGATVFYDALAGTPNGEADLGTATAIDMVVSSATISTGVIETNRVLLTYYGKDGP